MKRILILALSLIFVASMIFIGTGCKTEEAVEETEEAVEETVEAVEETEEAVEETVEEVEEEAGFDGQIIIGVSLPLTGNFAEHGQGQKAGYELALMDINASGGIMGMELVFDMQDSASDPTVSAENARKFIENPDIPIMLGDFSSGQSMATAPLCQEAGLPMLTPSSSSPAIPLTGDYIFGMVGTQPDEQRFNVIGIFKNYLGIESYAIIYENTDWGKAIADASQTYAAEGGLEVVAVEAINPGEKDFSSVLSKVKSLNPDGLYLGVQINEAAIIVNQMVQLGYTEEFKTQVSGGAFSQAFLDLVGLNADGMYTYSPFFPTEDDPESMAFQERFMEQSGGLKPNIMTAGPYDATFMAKEAIERAGSLERSAVRDALAQTKDFQGITGPITFDKDGMVHRLGNIIGIENGQYILLEGYDYFAEVIGDYSEIYEYE